MCSLSCWRIYEWRKIQTISTVSSKYPYTPSPTPHTNSSPPHTPSHPHTPPTPHPLTPLTNSTPHPLTPTPHRAVCIPTDAWFRGQGHPPEGGQWPQERPMAQGHHKGMSRVYHYQEEDGEREEGTEWVGIMHYFKWCWELNQCLCTTMFCKHQT